MKVRTATRSIFSPHPSDPDEPILQGDFSRHIHLAWTNPCEVAYGAYLRINPNGPSNPPLRIHWMSIPHPSQWIGPLDWELIFLFLFYTLLVNFMPWIKRLESWDWPQIWYLSPTQMDLFTPLGPISGAPLHVPQQATSHDKIGEVNKNVRDFFHSFSHAVPRFWTLGRNGYLNKLNMVWEMTSHEFEWVPPMVRYRGVSSTRTRVLLKSTYADSTNALRFWY